MMTIQLALVFLLLGASLGALATWLVMQAKLDWSREQRRRAEADYAALVMRQDGASVYDRLTRDMFAEDRMAFRIQQRIDGLPDFKDIGPG